LSILALAACSPKQEAVTIQRDDLSIQANMIFFYYDDLEKAVDFYEGILGLTLVLDYEFAKAYRISESSYICLVDHTQGMHDVSEPKTVALDFMTQQIEGWYTYLREQDVEIHTPLKEPTDYPFRNFIVSDPEGYLLEFESFTEHPQNKKLQEKVKRTTTFYSEPGAVTSRPTDLGIQANIYWLYYEDLDEAKKFYESILGLEPLTDEGFSDVYASSTSSFIGLVGPTGGLHSPTEQKAVNIGFFTKEVRDWYHYLSDRGVAMRGPLDEIEEGLVHAFVCFDPGGYFLEFDKFLDDERNHKLREILNY
jgi:catechol 2,3-dioxygenase-like lactoylglutathione lyase family enzyme